MRSAEKTETSSSVRFLSPALSVAFWNAVPCSLSPVALTGLYSLSRDSPGLKNEKERDARIEEKKERKRIESASEKKPWRTMTTTKKKEREKKGSLSLSLSLCCFLLLLRSSTSSTREATTKGPAPLLFSPPR